LINAKPKPLVKPEHRKLIATPTAAKRKRRSRGNDILLNLKFARK